ncbi:hypothetical protein PV08_11733 [Exophiala spinifera]|uniref:CCHC-type domain-containing protein n=1 Tax=Exophiala spinifera TaxID=91928 RepID=A0A0D1ZAD3_9EURO|nr:uncharacterized protein PV08_11733 [Exophiala spinifera]KIW09957.1 hypothetical protein PV08_11733 [Exophiala spinifera]
MASRPAAPPSRATAAPPGAVVAPLMSFAATRQAAPAEVIRALKESHQLDKIPFDVRMKGIIRDKVFPGTVCKECRLPHPTCYHGKGYYEAFKPCGSGSKELHCTQCGGRGHTVNECGKGEWRDFPDNPPLQHSHRTHFRPWPREYDWVPFPRHYYRPDLYPKADPMHPDLPKPIAQTGFEWGLAKAKWGLKYSIDTEYAFSRGLRPTKFDLKTVREWLPFAAIQEPLSAPVREPEARKEPPADSKVAKEKVLPNPEPKSEKKISSDATNAADPNEGYGGVTHHSSLPNPNHTEKNKGDLSPAWYKALAPMLPMEELRYSETLRGNLDAAIKQHEKGGSARTLNVLLAARQEVFDLYKIYMPHWSPARKKSFGDLPNKVKVVICSRIEERKEKAFQPPPPRKLDLQYERTRGQHGEPRFEEFVRSSGQEEPEEEELGDWADDDDFGGAGAATTTQDRRHPQIMPRSDEEADVHIKGLMDHVFSEFVLNRVVIRKYEDFIGKTLEDLNEKASQFATVLKANESKSEEKDRIVAKTREFLNAIKKLPTRWIGEVDQLIVVIKIQCNELGDDTERGMKNFTALQQALQKAFDDFERNMADHLSKCFSIEGVSEPFLSWLSSSCMEDPEVIAGIQGAFLPDESQPRAQLPRFTWPEYFLLEVIKKVAEPENDSKNES